MGLTIIFDSRSIGNIGAAVAELVGIARKLV